MYELEYIDIEEKNIYENTIKKVIERCFDKEHLKDSKIYISIILTNPNKIREINNKYRNIDKETDVLSFPMFEKEELENKILNKEFVNEEVLGDIIISIQRVEEQAKDYGHTFERELAYMIVHGFYHLMGYDHIEEKDKKEMRLKEKQILNELEIKR